MFSNIIFCKHVCVHICLQALNNLYYTINQIFTKEQIKGFSNIHVLLFFSFRFYKLPNILIFKHKRTEYKKEKGQLSHTIKKSRADRSSRQKTPTSLLHSININKKHNYPKVTYEDLIDKERKGNCR